MSLAIQYIMGSDLSVVNAARASFMKESRQLTPADCRLIRFLAENGHTSPFRHAAARFRLTTTLAQRILWESGRRTDQHVYRAGMVFYPRLTDLLLAGYGLEDTVEWRWTASLEAMARFITEFRYDQECPVLANYAVHLDLLLAMYFPESIHALTGTVAQSRRVFERPPVPELKIHCLDRGYVRLVDFQPGETPEEQILSLEVKAPMVTRSQWFKQVRNSNHLPPGFISHPLEEEGTGNGDDCDRGDGLYARNEASRRYVTLPPEFYIPAPDAWRAAPENRKQGSAGSLPVEVGEALTADLQVRVLENERRYEEALAQGVAAEQARGFLNNYFMYSTWRWTASMSAVNFFLEQRLAHDAQHEIQVYAKAVAQIVSSLRW